LINRSSLWHSGTLLADSVVINNSISVTNDLITCISWSTQKKQITNIRKQYMVLYKLLINNIQSKMNCLNCLQSLHISIINLSNFSRNCFYQEESDSPVFSNSIRLKCVKLVWISTNGRIIIFIIQILKWRYKRKDKTANSQFP